jgi:hypothetical protein
LRGRCGLVHRRVDRAHRSSGLAGGAHRFDPLVARARRVCVCCMLVKCISRAIGDTPAGPTTVTPAPPSRPPAALLNAGPDNCFAQYHVRRAQDPVGDEGLVRRDLQVAESRADRHRCGRRGLPMQRCRHA